MSTLLQSRAGALELREAQPAVSVQEAEYWRLLGYPKDHVASERARELADWARAWYAEHGRPWIYLREAAVTITDDVLLLDGVEFRSRLLHEHLRRSDTRRAMLVVVSAGAACEQHARQLWQESKPDEYYFLEIFGSAVVENLVAGLNGRICAVAAQDGLIAIPHYSPGYTGWDIEDQNKLFELVARLRSEPWPEALEVLPSGMLRPKKSLLAVVGLAPRTAENLAAGAKVPCESCGLSPCRFRRAAYRHASSLQPTTEGARAMPVNAPLAPGAKYSVSLRALEKWAGERVRILSDDAGGAEACFRFDGTTCSNMGRALSFEYRVSLSGPADRYRILRADCHPIAGDDGYQSMCAYLSDPDRLMGEIAAEKPLLGQPLDEVFSWRRESAPSGCYCTAASRAHKWGLALEAIHFTLARSERLARVLPPKTLLSS